MALKYIRIIIPRSLFEYKDHSIYALFILQLITISYKKRKRFNKQIPAPFT